MGLTAVDFRSQLTGKYPDTDRAELERYGQALARLSTDLLAACIKPGAVPGIDTALIFPRALDRNLKQQVLVMYKTSAYAPIRMFNFTHQSGKMSHEEKLKLIADYMKGRKSSNIQEMDSIGDSALDADLRTLEVSSSKLWVQKEGGRPPKYPRLAALISRFTGKHIPETYPRNIKGENPTTKYLLHVDANALLMESVNQQRMDALNEFVGLMPDGIGAELESNPRSRLLCQRVHNYFVDPAAGRFRLQAFQTHRCLSELWGGLLSISDREPYSPEIQLLAEAIDSGRNHSKELAAVLKIDKQLLKKIRSVKPADLVRPFHIRSDPGAHWGFNVFPVVLNILSQISQDKIPNVKTSADRFAGFMHALVTNFIISLPLNDQAFNNPSIAINTFLKKAVDNYTWNDAYTNSFRKEDGQFIDMDAVKSTASAARDAISAYMDCVIVPEFEKRLRGQPGITLHDYFALKKQFMPEVASMVLGGKGFNAISATVDSWHRRQAHLNEAILDPQFLQGEEWTPIFPEEIVAPNGLRLITLTNADELTAEGARDEKGLHHCVGGYSKDCLIDPKGVHIVSVRDVNGNRLSTIEFHEAPRDKAKLEVKQHHGKGDSKVAKDSLQGQALEWLKIEVAEGRIPIDFNRLYTDRQDRIRKLNDPRNLIGYDPVANPERQGQAFKLYAFMMNRRMEDGIKSDRLTIGGHLQESGLKAEIDQACSLLIEQKLQSQLGRLQGLQNNEMVQQR